jgi:hypothetical protein
VRVVSRSTDQEVTPVGLRHLSLTTEQREELLRIRDADPKPYLRERATALLKVTEGMSPASIARQGLLRPRQPDTVYTWLNRFLELGCPGLRIRPGRGRKPAFSPSVRHRVGCQSGDPPHGSA